MKTRRCALIIALLVLIGCTTEDYSSYTYSNELTIYSEENNTSFRELIVILKPYLMDNDQKKYILTDTITNIVIKINDNNWGTFSSLEIDTSLFNTEIINDTRVYLKTKKKYQLDYDETLKIVVDDSTEVINPMIDE